MTVRELRRKFLAFFAEKGHQNHPSGNLVPYDVTGRLDESLLFNGAGMVQFKPYFRGAAQPPHPRLITAQKCLRTGDIDETGDTSHLTFFEMLGNFSFGDYFKTEAIAYSWEFLTSSKWLALDPTRLSFTVFLEDDEAETAWHSHLSAAGIDPATRVFRLGEETNYWPAGSFSKGPPGPCGPNSEMFYWTGDGPAPGAPYSTEDWLRDESQGLWLEIWNDVFIQYEWQGDAAEKGWTKTGMPELPFRSVDTGMGIERTSAVLSGFSSVYDTDVFAPIFAALMEIGAPMYGNGQADVAQRIIADHLRSATFCIADGVLPSNSGRGYVLRRLIRRAVLKGVRGLGFTDLFLHQLVGAVVEAMGDHYHEIVERREVIEETLRNEEAQFRRTLAQGTDLLSAELSRVKDGVLPGEVAFRLYDTYGFPVEITRELAHERGVEIDDAGYATAMAEAQARSRGASEMESVYAEVGGSDWGREVPPTRFVGYDRTNHDSEVVGYAPGRIALADTPFYAESGGQVGDTGTIIVEGVTLTVSDVVKEDGVFVHRVSGAPDGFSPVGKSAAAQVDESRRRAIIKHHTATHLLHAALRETLGTHVTQAGSRVAPEELRFDFTHGAGMTSNEREQVEDRVNQMVMDALPVVIYSDLAIEEARGMGAMALFGEKYADRVRVVQIGGMPMSEPSFSRELCGGVHVGNTGQIGLFRIVSEGSAAGGVRRIVAVCGEAAIASVREESALLEEAARRLKTAIREVPDAIDRLSEQLKEERKRRERMAASGGGAVSETKIGAVVLRTERLEDADAAAVKLVADRLVEKSPSSVALVVSVTDGKVLIAAKCGAVALAAGAHAGNLVKAVAQVTGGGGGGRPEFATAGGRDATKVDEALATAVEIVRQVVGA
ncbi:MAG: alanine--tRNA ligase [Fimbriimonadaceae bacterium]|nr:alanine--tRNA ligase [Fimbriimonadaceae bacterium]